MGKSSIRDRFSAHKQALNAERSVGIQVFSPESADAPAQPSSHLTRGMEAGAAFAPTPPRVQRLYTSLRDYGQNPNGTGFERSGRGQSKPQLQSHNLVFCRLNYVPDVEGPPGIEPGAEESESSVFPLHHGPAGRLRIELRPRQSKCLVLTLTPPSKSKDKSC